MDIFQENQITDLQIIGYEFQFHPKPYLLNCQTNVPGVAFHPLAHKYWAEGRQIGEDSCGVPYGFEPINITEQFNSLTNPKKFTL